MDLRLIKTIASKKNITLDDLANMAGIKRTTFFNYLSGKTSIPADILKSLADILEIPIAKFYDEAGNLELLEVNDPTASYGIRRKIRQVPLIHKFAHVEYLAQFGNDDFFRTLPKYPVLLDQPAQGSYLCFEVASDNMYDGTFESRLEGDIILAREMTRQQWSTNLTTPKHNAIILHRKEGPQFRRIIAHDVEKNSVVTHSLNGQYEDAELPLKEVLALFTEVKLVGRNAGI